MNIAVVTLRKEPAYRRGAVESGLKRLGYTVVTNGRPTSRDDVLVTWNLHHQEQQAAQWEQRGGTVIVMENAYLQKVDKSMYALSVHGHNGSGWFPVGTEDRFAALGIPMKEMVDRSGYDLVCAQRGIGSKLMASPHGWAEKMAAKLKAQGRTVKVRPHPGNFAPKVPLLEDLKGAARCVIWSSGSGVRALVEGVPVVHSAPHWICAGWEGNRAEALHRMSHGQWRHEEIATGEPFAHMRDAGWGVETWA